MPRTKSHWSQPSVLWLGALILAASIAGCIVLIGLAASLPDDQGGPRHEELQFKVPATRSSRDCIAVEPALRCLAGAVVLRPAVAR